MSKSRRIYMTGTVRPGLAKQMVSRLQQLDEESNEDIVIFITTFGGCCRSMMAIRDQMKRCRCDIKTIVVGYAMSAGWFISNAGTPGKRYATANSHIMGHGPNGAAPLTEEGMYSMDFYAEYAFKYIAEDSGHDPEFIASICERDLYMFPEKAKELNFIDHII